MILIKEKNQLFLTVALSILYCIGLIIYNINYLDDYGRYLLGYSGLSGNGRPIADLVLTIINFGYPLLDLSPLSLLLSIFIIAISGIVIADRFFKNEKPVIRSLVALLFLVNPFFIENLSFKYDIFPMSLSILTISLAFYHINNPFLKMAAPVFLIFISLGLYQATLGMFVIFSIIELTESIINNRGTHKSRFINAGIRAVQLIIAYILYKIIIVNFFIAGDYASNLSKTITVSPEGLTTLTGNFHRFNEFVGSYTESIPLVMISFYIISLLTSIWILAKKSWSSSKSILNVITLVVSPFLFYFFSYATFLFLENAAVTSRVMISFSATLVGFAFYLLLAIKKTKIKLIVLLPFFIFSYVLSTSYVNASMAQNRKDSRIINSIYNDISHLSPPVKFVNFSGVVSPAPQKALSLMRFPILRDLTKSYLGTDWSAYMLNYNGINVSRMYFSSEEASKICSQKAISETPDYKIHVSGENMIISFDNVCK
ncbi:glucosyltransferase domain-containing protein [Pseudescherichia vulneris]|uniref:glucosyltransferase domain-containing protein n=1 Tax=Pseudescherichia vulneris TaxID=566 RepID=UPI001EDCA6F5|nr:glucosyltransferase domain-containing protein [Pseudescherichia vulneris]